MNNAPIHMTFVCFSTANMKRQREVIISDAKRLGIFSDVHEWDEDKLVATSEYCNLPSRIKKGRGFGFFWWKPFIIRKALEQKPKGGLVFYSDCGRYDGGYRLADGAKYLIDAYAETGFAGVEVPQFGAARRWTRASCYSLTERASVWEGLPQIQATFSLWRNDENTQALLSRWEAACRLPELIADPTEDEKKSEPAAFVAHRHDQSLLTILARGADAPIIRMSTPLRSRVMPLLAKAEVVNTAMKHTQVVAEMLKTNRVTRLLITRYLLQKLGKL